MLCNDKGDKEMKYIRTKDGRIIDLTYYKELGELNGGIKFERITNGSIMFVQQNNILKKTDTIEELCDEFIHGQMIFRTLNECLDYAPLGGKIYGAIWTEKGLIYVAKMNDKGELELL